MAVSKCPICNQPLDDDSDAVFDGRSHLTCVDSLAVVCMDAAERGNEYARTVVESLFKSARELLFREQAIDPAQLRLV